MTSKIDLNFENNKKKKFKLNFVNFRTKIRSLKNFQGLSLI